VPIRDELKRELIERGFTECRNDGLESPHRSLVLHASSYTTSSDLAELLEVMVFKREKAFRADHVLGPEAAREVYHDVVIVIDAVKAVIARLSLPSAAPER
jgi:hypothetical protein